MIIDKVKEVESNIEGSVDFSFSDHAAKLFSMLSSHLYTDKELAVLHELGQNAEDAHVLVGKRDTPFDVVFPTDIDSVLRIRDYGPGLSEDNVYRLLTKYGESDKQGSNEFRGGWGIGAKSPASVTDTWRVVSHFDGMMKEYMVFVNGHSIPSMKKIREVVTAETGIEVVIPVNRHRISVWKAAAEKAFKLYKVRPNFKNAVINLTDNRKHVFESNGWKLFSAAGYYKQVNATFVSSCREYSPQVDKIKAELKDHIVDVVISSQFQIEFLPGELHHGINREDIQYSAHSLKAIKEKCYKVFNEFAAIVNGKVAGINDKLEYLVELNKIYNHGDINWFLIAKVIDGNAFGIKRQEELNGFSVDVPPASSCRVFKNGASSTCNSSSFSCFKTRLIGFNSGQSYNVAVPNKPSLYFSTSVFDKLVVVVNDKCYASLSRVREYSKTVPNKYIVLTDHKFAEKVFDRFTITASSLPHVAIKKASSVATNKVVSTLYILKGRKFYPVLDTPKVGDPVVRFTNAGSTTSIVDPLESRWVNNHYFDEIGITVYGVKSKAPLPKNTLTLKQYVDHHFEKAEKEELAKKMTASNMMNEIRFSSPSYFSLMFRTVGKSVWNDVYDSVEQIKNDGIIGSAVNKRLIEFLQRCKSKTLDGVCAVRNVSALNDSLIKAYPMLKYISRGSDVKEVRAYVELVAEKEI